MARYIVRYRILEFQSKCSTPRDCFALTEKIPYKNKGIFIANSKHKQNRITEAYDTLWNIEHPFLRTIK